MSRQKTQAEKALSGTVRLDRTGAKRAKVVTTNTIPRPQTYLSSSGKKIYKELAEHLLKHNALCKIDSFYLSKAAQHFDMFAEAAKKVAKEGLYQVSENGYENFSAAYNVMNKEAANINEACKMLGLHLQARDKIIAFAKDETQTDKKDPIAAMMERRMKAAGNE